MSDNFHADQPVLSAGLPLEKAKRVMILLHGRGATAESILDLADLLEQPDMAYLAPQAAFYRWYPNSFLSSLEKNEPDLTYALARVDELVSSLLARGYKSSDLWLGGFSQGACLAAEYAARSPQRFGGLLVFSGGLIGPLNSDQERAPVQDLSGMSVFVGCSDIDPHIPVARVRETAEYFRRANASVDLQIYPGMEHTIVQEELERAINMLKFG